nr:MAG TPA_asm: hypothetical protein [Caudoviricetes sp.]
MPGRIKQEPFLKGTYLIFKNSDKMRGGYFRRPIRKGKLPPFIS